MDLIIEGECNLIMSLWRAKKAKTRSKIRRGK